MPHFTWNVHILSCPSGFATARASLATGDEEERVCDDALVPEFHGVIEGPVRPVHRACQVARVLEKPSAEFRELAGEPEHLGPVGAPGDLACPFNDGQLELDGDFAESGQHGDGARARQVAEHGTCVARARAQHRGV